jgi:hypothetical protein
MESKEQRGELWRTENKWESTKKEKKKKKKERERKKSCKKKKKNLNRAGQKQFFIQLKSVQ